MCKLQSNMESYPSTSHQNNCPDIYKPGYTTGVDRMNGEGSASDGAFSPPEIVSSSTSSTSSIQKRPPKNQNSSLCLVCESPAVGYHYDVPSCNGCKNFFRRTILAGRKFFCPNDGNCIVDGTETISPRNSKRICRACRFEKCVEVGMNPLAIQADVTNEEGKQLREEIMEKRNSSKVAISSSKMTSPPSQEMIPRNQCPPNCLVCHNPAVGYHYDIPSCNGCKTFFRRTIMNGRQYVCLNRGNCIPDDNEPLDMSRRICRACRFEKCVQAGMNPAAIQAEVKSNEGKVLREEVMRKRNSDGELSIAKKFQFTTTEEQISHIIEELLFVESKIEPLQKQGLPPGYEDQRTLEEILQSSPIFSAHEIPNLVYAAPKVSKKTGEIEVRSTNYIHTSFLATIEYSKTLDYHKNVDMNSKVALLRHGTHMCSVLMNSFFSIHYLNSDRVVNPDGSDAGPTERKIKKYGFIYKNQKDLLQRTLIALLRLRIEKIEYLLLKAIALCNPAVDGLTTISQKAIEKDRRKFSQCLFNYCMVQHGKVNGPSRFTDLIAITTVIENQQKYHKDFHIFIKAIHHWKHLEKPKNKRVSILFDEIMEN